MRNLCAKNVKSLATAGLLTLVRHSGIAQVVQQKFLSKEGRHVPALTAEEMREVDRVAVEDFGLGILQMMENAGQNLAHHAKLMLGGADVRLREGPKGRIVVLTGAGGNGGGGLYSARHLHNRGYEISLLLDREPEALGGSAEHQMAVLRPAGLQPIEPNSALSAIQQADLVLDALIGYSLRGAPRGRAAELILLCNQHAAQILSLDVPSGLDATSGKALGDAVRPDRTLTLALPKTVLREIPSELYLADIGIPLEVYLPLGLFVGAFSAINTGCAFTQTLCRCNGGESLRAEGVETSTPPRWG
jgi:NAD(P)H-hydrate epimerase